jgi:DNA-binding PadR family transcriptional regulator
LYGSIKRMLQSQLIEEVSSDNSRRKYYTLTEKGRKYLSFELQRYKDAVELAKQKNLFDSLGLIQLAF